MEVVLVLAVNRQFTPKGAQLESLQLLRDLDDGGWKEWFETLKKKECGWDELLELATQHGGNSYYIPNTIFTQKNRRKDSSRTEAFTTILHPITIEGRSAEILLPVRNFFDYESNDGSSQTFAKLIGSICNLGGNLTADHEGFTDLLNHILQEVLKLGIPPLVPFGKCEWDYLSKSSPLRNSSFRTPSLKR